MGWPGDALELFVIFRSLKGMPAVWKIEPFTPMLRDELLPYATALSSRCASQSGQEFLHSSGSTTTPCTHNPIAVVKSLQLFGGSF